MARVLQMPRLYPRMQFPPHWRPRGNFLADKFTPKERNIMDGITCGEKNHEIATKLHTTEHVIKNYLRGIYDKAGVYTRLEMALWWLEHGYITREECEENDRRRVPED